jgi:hypothetical protein
LDGFFRLAIDAASDSGKWLLDAELEGVWGRLDAWLAGIPVEWKRDAAAAVVGALVLPTGLIPAPGAAGVEKSVGRRIRRAQNVASTDLRKAAQALRKAAELIAKARNDTNIVPDVAITTFHFFIKTVPASYRNCIPSTLWVKPDSVRMLLDMANELEGAERLDAIPGFESQKSSWRDWLRAAHDSLCEAGVTHGAKIDLREVDYVCLMKAATGGLATRDSVRSALRYKRKIIL